MIFSLRLVVCIALLLSVVMVAVASSQVTRKNDNDKSNSNSNDLPSISVVQTARDTGDRLTSKGFVNFIEGDVNPLITSISLNTKTTYQQLVGFGGAFTEAAMYTLGKLPSDLQQEVMNAYFGKSSQQYTLCRVHINSCDFSLSSYSYDDTLNDMSLSRFNMSHDFLYLIPNMLKAQALSASNNRSLSIFGTPWSPPAWMKGNNEMDHSSQPCLKNATYQAVWANYISRWATEYKALGINLWGMTVQNEPEFDAPWEACTYTAEEELAFVKLFLGPVMKRDHPDLNILIFDHNKDHVAEWAKTIMRDPTAAQYLWGTAFHWYSGPEFDNLNLAHQAAPEKHLLATEACNCPGVLIGDWSRGEAYGYDILGDLNHWATGWVDWNMLLDQQGGPNHVGNFCDAPIIAVVNTNKPALIYQPPFWYMGHFSRYLPPKSTRIHIDLLLQGAPLFDVTAFLTPANDIVVIVLNRSSAPVKYNLLPNGGDGGGNGGSENKDVVYASLEIPAHGIQTLSFPNNGDLFFY